jgi:hypothetical protein
VVNCIKKIISHADEKIFAALLWSTQTKAAFYCLLLIIIVATVISPPTSVYLWLMVVVSIGYQGCVLPGIGYTGKQAEKAANKQGEMTRELVQEIHEWDKESHEVLLQAFAELGDMMAELKAAHDDLRMLVSQVHVKIVGAEEVDVTTTTEASE